MRRARPIAAFAALMVAAVAAPIPAAAEPLDLAAVATVDDEELADQRGGFRFNGMDISFAAQIRTFIGGELVLETLLRVSDTVEVTTVAADSLTRVNAADLPAGVLDTGPIVVRLAGDGGFVTGDGQTVLIHRTEGALQNIVINTMSGLDVTQSIDASLGLGNYEAFRAAAIADTALSQALSMVNLASSGGLGH
jgi:hypothetical protein